MTETNALIRKQAAFRFCGVDPWEETQAYDVTFVGIPTDIGMHRGGRSAAGGPSALRNASRLLPSVSDPGGRSIGWHDYSQGRTLLSGRRLADAGDLLFDRYRPLEGLKRIPNELARLRENSELVVVLGGDHSLSYWTTNLCGSPGVLLFVDAHEDATDIVGELPHSGNVISFIERDRDLEAIVQYGLRGLVPNQRREPALHRVICADVADWTSEVNNHRSRPAILSIDADVLDPKLVGAVAAPSPGGLTPPDLVTAVQAACRSGAHIVQLELVEYAPASGDGPLEAFTLAQLLLRLTDACLDIS